jgi:hypothetical protein
MSSNDYKIAVMLPTRGRTVPLKLSIISVFNRVLDLDKVQLILGFDDDDEIGLKYFSTDIQPWMQEKGIHYTVMTFKPMGYEGLNRYYNAMAEQSSADWLFVWNDDALMETTGWDRIVEKYNGQFKLLKVHGHKEHPYSIFPILPREWYDLFGFFSRHQMIDAELSQNAYMLDIMEIVDIYVTHDRHDLTGNNNDATAKARKLLEGNLHDPEDFHHIGYAQARMHDCETIAAHLKARGIDTGFWENVKKGKQDPWEKLKKNDINKQMVQYERPQNTKVKVPV